MFLEAISRFPLYLLFCCASQKDAAAIGANIECSFYKFVISTNEKTYCNSSETTPSKISLKSVNIHHPSSCIQPINV